MHKPGWYREKCQCYGLIYHIVPSQSLGRPTKQRHMLDGERAHLELGIHKHIFQVI